MKVNSVPLERRFFDTQYDAVIAGGGLSGLGTAFSLAGQGKKILVVESRGVLGWESTSTYENTLEESDTYFGNLCRSYLESRKKLKGNLFDVPFLTLAINQLVDEAEIDVLLYSHPLGLKTKNGSVIGLVIGNISGQQVVKGDIFVDATETGILWRQSNSPLQENPNIPGRQRVFFNCVDQKMDLPLYLGDFGKIKDMTLQPTLWDGEICAQFDIPSCSISAARLLLPEVLFFLRANIPQLQHALVTHAACEPFPLEARAYMAEKSLQHPVLSNLLGAGLWTIADETKRREVNTLAGRIKLGEDVAAFVCSSEVKSADHSDACDKGTEYPSSALDHCETDVIVCGGGVSGVIAAISAARKGVRTTLIEASSALGGLGTDGAVHSYYPMQPLGLGRLAYSSRKLEVEENVFSYCYRTFGGLQDEVDARTAKVANFLFDGLHKCYGFHPEAKKLVLEQMCYEAGVKVIYGATAIGVELLGSSIDRVIVATQSGPVAYKAKVVIDGTGDAHIAAMAGVPFTLGREWDGVQHTFTQLGEFLTERGSLTLGGCPTDLDYVDSTDVTDLTRARRLGLKHLSERLDSLKSRLLFIAPLLGTRQSRQIDGEYKLTLNDQIFGRCFEDSIGYLQAHYDNHTWTYESETDESVLWVWLLGNWERVIGCEIPYRCLVPLQVDGLLVACRGMSMTTDAHYAFRMQPDLQQIGEAAGIAAALAVKLNVPPRLLDARMIQEDMRTRGMLDEKRRPRAFMTERPLSELRDLLFSDKPQEAVWQLAHSDIKEVRSILREGLHSTSFFTRFWASVVLAMHRDNSGVPELLKCVTDRVSQIPEGLKTVPLWYSAVVLLGRVGDPRAIPVLSGILHDRSEDLEADVLIAAVRALGRIGDKAAVPELLCFLDRKDLGSMKRLPRPVAEDIGWELELAAAEALVRCGAVQEGMNVVQRYATDSRGYVRRYANKIAGLAKGVKEDNCK